MGKSTAVMLAAGGALAAGTAAALGGAQILFNRTIPRQDVLRVDMSEMADMAKWEEYKVGISKNKEWLLEQKLEEITIVARDGIRLHAYYLPAETPSDRLVVGFHGYTSRGLSDFCSHAHFFHQQGFDCLIPDHRAHGESEGEYVGFGILDRFDCRKWIDYVEERFAGKKRILLHGTSMGASTILMAAGDPGFPSSVKGMIADCAFTSPYDVFKHILKRDYHLPEFPVLNINTRISRKKAGYGFRDYSTLTALEQSDCPVLLIHGTEDHFVPVWMSKQNFRACRAPKELVLIENAGHGASYYENPAKYEEAEERFIRKWIPEHTVKEELS